MSDLLQLGLFSGPGDKVWTCTKYMDDAQIGTLVRNSCMVDSDDEKGDLFLKINSTQWIRVRPDDHEIVDSSEIFLPVQVVGQVDMPPPLAETPDALYVHPEGIHIDAENLPVEIPASLPRPDFDHPVEPEITGGK